VLSQSRVQVGEDQHCDPREGGEQVPAGLLQPPQEQHGRSQAPEKTESQEGDSVKCDDKKQPDFITTKDPNVNYFDHFISTQKKTLIVKLVLRGCGLETLVICAVIKPCIDRTCQGLIKNRVPGLSEMCRIATGSISETNKNQ